MATTNVTAAQADAGLWESQGGIWSGTITYSVPGANGASASWVSGYGDGEPVNAQYGTFDATQADNFRAVLETWDTYIANSMTEVSDGTPGQIRGAFTDVNVRYPNADAYAYGPSTGGVSPEAGDIWVDESEKSTSFARNTQGFELLLHEAGHSLGLKHPFEQPTLPEGYDSTIYTVMSYTHPDYFYTWSGNSMQYGATATPTIAYTPMVLDIQAIQGRYGADTATNAGATTYAFNDSSLNGRQAIYDAGGTDTIDLSALSRGSTLDLRPGAYSDLAYYDVDDQIDDLAAIYGEDANTRNFITQVMKNPSQPAYEWTKNLGLSFTSRIENATGSALADNITGNTLANTLNGGGGNDVLRGLTGNDSYVVDRAGDRVFEVAGAGADRVLARVSYALAAGQEIETLATTSAGSTGSINLTGNETAQTLQGNAGANLLDGRGGADTLYGFAGNDTYRIDNFSDRVIEAAGGGSDRVFTSVGYVLTASQEIETLATTSAAGTGSINLIGNDKAQTIYGNAGVNTIESRGGIDTLYGYGGKDNFLFKSALGSSNVDRISDFSHVDDTIQLGKSIFSALPTGQLASNAFKDKSLGAVDSNDRVIYDRSTGALSYDADGSGASASAVQFATLLNKPTNLDYLDFLVVA